MYFTSGVSLRKSFVAVGAMAGGDLETLIERIQRLEDRRSVLTCDIHDLFDAAKEIGFDTKVMRQAIKLCRRDFAERNSKRDFCEAYNEAVEIGMHESWF